MAVLKNPTPTNIALLAAFLVAIIPAAFILIIGFEWHWAFVCYGTTTIASYLIFNQLLEIFIYRKIKVIYKNIHQLKTKGLKQDYQGDPITEVSDEVFAWAKERRNEIQALKKQENFRREFLGNVSHELKTPIFNIQGYIHTLLDGALDDKEVNSRFLRKAARSADRLTELVQDLVTISQIETGQMEMNLQTFDIRELAIEICDSLEMYAKERTAAIALAEGTNKPHFVLADRSRIKQVLTNLITNAIKYGKENGEVRIKFFDMDKNLLIEVSDDGDGIEEEHLPRLFERFYRVDKSRNREAGGSGLGLAIVKHIIEAHNQTINVRSSIGKGTTFGFTLKKSKESLANKD